MIDRFVVCLFVGAIAYLLFVGWREWRAEQRDRLNRKRKELERIYRRSRK